MPVERYHVDRPRPIAAVAGSLIAVAVLVAVVAVGLALLAAALW